MIQRFFEWVAAIKIRIILHFLQGRAVLMTKTGNADTVTYHFNYRDEDEKPQYIAITHPRRRGAG